ncbi:MAG: two-component regulator propeller domain-containing protein, partial [Flavobacteriales bacterium]
MRRHPLALIALTALAPAARSQQFNLRTYSLPEGLPSSTVHAICEDADGFLWVGTAQGAARGDGLRFEAITRQHGLPHDQVTALAADADGSVWMGFGNGALARWDQGRITVLLPGPGPAVRSLTLIGGAPWWAAAANGIGQLKEDRAVYHGPAEGLLGAQALALAIDHRGRPLAGTDSGLFVLSAGHWQAVARHALPSPRVQALWSDERGVVAATANGFLELDTALASLPAERRFTGFIPLALPEKNMLAALRTRSGELWFGTPGGLLHLRRKNGYPSVTLMREANGLGHDLVRCLAQDRSGAVWIGTGFGGLTKYTSDAFLHFTDRDGLGSRTVSAIHHTPDGRLWLGTAGGGLTSWDSRGLRHYGPAEGLPDPFVISLGEDVQGHLLVGTASQGLWRYDEKRFSRITAGFDGQRVYSIRLDDEGRSWVGTDRGLYADPGDGRYARIGGFDLPIAATACNDDTLWAATVEGLYLLDTRRMPWRLRPVHLLPPASMTSLALDAAGNLWIGTEAHGLYRLNGTRADSITPAEGLSSTAVEQVLLDGVQNVWAGTRRGICLIELDALQERVLRVRAFGTDDGFIAAECFRNACLLDSDSSLWFGTVRGATRYDPRSSLLEEPEPRLHITDLRLFFERADWSPWSKGSGAAGLPIDLRLPHHRNHLTFGFIGISLAFPEKVRYRYM